MAIEYKTLVYNDDSKGRSEMARAINRLSAEGWTIKSKDVAPQNYTFGKTCCLGCIFLPLALLGKKKNAITLIMERHDSNKHQASAEINSIDTKVDEYESSIVDKTKTKWYKTWWGILVIIFIVMSGISAIGSASRSIDPTQTPEAKQIQADAKEQQQKQEKVQERQTAIDTYSPVYCANQQKIIVNEPQLLAQGWPNADGNHGVTNEECVMIITKLYDYLADYLNIPSRLKSISERKVFVGMGKIELIYSWGEPNDVNKTTYSGGTSEQWVYGNPIYSANYVYLDNDIVTSMQN